MIFVYRDPRDTFCSWIKHKWVEDEDIEKFLTHYKSAYSEYPHDHKKIIDISFEDFVLNHEAVSRKILDFIGISKNSRVDNPKYNLEYSKKNIGRWKSYPNQQVMDKIAEELKDRLWQ